MTFLFTDPAERYRAAVAQATDRGGVLGMDDLDAIATAFQDAFRRGARQTVIWQYHDGYGRSAPTSLWRAVHTILDAPDAHPLALVERARRLHLLLSSAADCDTHERAVQNDARIMATWKEKLPSRPLPAECTWTRSPGTRRSR